MMPKSSIRKCMVLFAVALVVIVSGCTFPIGTYVYPGVETSNDICVGWICEWTYSNTELTCIRDAPCTDKSTIWVADTGIDGTGTAVCPGGLDPCYCTGYGAIWTSLGCVWNPVGNCFLDDGKSGNVVAGKWQPGSTGGIIGCQFEGASSSTTLTFDLTGTIIPEEPIPEPEPPADIWSSFVSVFQNLWNWFIGWFPLGQVVASGETAVAGDVFQHTFILANTASLPLPDDYYLDGDRTWLYYGYAVFDPSGNMVTNTMAEITQVIEPGTGITLPASYTVEQADPSGQYAVIASMISVTSVWDTATGSWVEMAPAEIDKAAVSFTVQTITPPPTPSFDFSQWITSLFTAAQDWLCSNLGVFC